MAEWVKEILSIAREADNFNTSPDSTKRSCVFLYCDGVRIGCIKHQILQDLLRYNEIFVAEKVDGKIRRVKIAEDLKTVEERTIAVNRVFKELQIYQDRYPCLRGWRSENYAVGEYFGRPILLHCERAGARLLGVKQYGVHMTGYVKTESGGYKLWIGRRSLKKATYPGLLDNMVAGGMEAGSTVLQTLIKECYEEASIGPDLACKAKPVGTISYCHETIDGIEPETEFLYDLELPHNFIPIPRDGEVSDFYLWDVKQVTNEIAQKKFKPNCALVVLQFLLQHGIITPDKEPEYINLASCCHVQLTED